MESRAATVRKETLWSLQWVSCQRKIIKLMGIIFSLSVVADLSPPPSVLICNTPLLETFSMLRTGLCQRWTKSKRVLTFKYIRYPVTTCCYQLQPVVTSCYQLQPVVTSYNVYINIFNTSGWNGQTAWPSGEEVHSKPLSTCSSQV